MSTRTHVVRVTIMGEEYAIRSDAPPEHTRELARYVDQAIRTVTSPTVVVETHKAAILAALQITAELFREREHAAEAAELARELGAEIRRWLPPARRGDGV